MGKKGLRLKAEVQLASADGGGRGVGVAFFLKGQERSLHLE